jgi:hypothetical protein
VLALHQAAISGNVAAQKAWLQRTDILPESPRRVVTKKAPKLGKKEIQQVEAANPDAGSTIGEIMLRRMAGEKSTTH